MGDRTTYTVQIRGTDPAVRAAVGRWLEDQWSFEDDGNGDTWYAYQTNIGHTGEIAEGLDRLMVDLDEPFAYRIDEDPVYEFDGTWYGWIPGLGDSGGGIDGSGTIHVDADQIDRAIDQARDLPVLVNVLHKLTGRTWRLAWDLLDAPLPEPDNPMPDPEEVAA